MYLPYIPESNRLEFPPGSGSVSGIWYTDLPPQSVSGVSGLVPIIGDCTYCLTSFIKVAYTLIKEPTGPIIGNLLDRVVDKIKEVIPIHVRDLFVDLTINIEIPLDITVQLLAEEDSFLQVSVVDRYDIFAADVIETDRHLTTIMNYGN